MVSARAVAEKAFDQLAAFVTPADQVGFRNITMDEVLETARRIEQEQSRRRDLRFMRRIEPFLRTMNSYSEVLSILCQGYPPMSFVWGPVKFMLDLAKNYTNVIDIILQAFHDIAESLPRIDRLKKIFPDDENLNRVIACIYSDLLEFYRRAYKMFRRRAWHYWFAFDWGLYEKRFKSVLQNLAQHSELLDKEAAVTHFAEMRNYREKRRIEDESFERRRRIEIAKEVHAWTSELEDSQEERLHWTSNHRQAGTCNWVLEDSKMKAWLEEADSNDVLWMTGIPGSGKTYIVSFIVQHLESRESGCHGYFFCDQKVSMSVDCVKILRTIMAQIVQQNFDITPFVHETYIEKMSTRSIVAMKRLFVQIVPNIKPTYLVLDGLDELNPAIQEDVLKAFLDIVKSSNHNCKLLISSRDEPQLRRHLVQRQMKLQNKTADGLRQYIIYNIAELRKDHVTMSTALVESIENSLHQKAGGMFLWVHLVISMLREKGALSEIESALNDLPDGLDQAYGRILDRFNHQLNPYRRQRVLRILQWMCVTRRPITIDEMVDALALTFEQRELCRNTRITDVKKHIFDLCAPILEQTSEHTMELVHFSAKEYLLHEGSGPFTEEFQAHFEVIKCCAINLNSASELISSQLDSRDTVQEQRVAQGQYGLYSYASRFWLEHLLCFLAECTSVRREEKLLREKLLQELRDFARKIIKPSDINQSYQQPTLDSGKLLKGLRSLESDPLISRLAFHALAIPKKIEDAKSAFDAVEKQEEKILLSDRTYMTHIDCRFRRIKEDLLALDPSELPSHIDPLDHTDFINRYRFSCRYLGCFVTFGSREERDDHQRTHTALFPCPYCDFSFRGFSCRRNLNKHIEKYHLDPGGYEIPPSIRSQQGGARGAMTGDVKSCVRPWNEQGRQAIRKGLRQILETVKTSPRQPLAASGKIQLELQEHQAARLENLRIKIEQETYDSLEDFKTDIRAALSDGQPHGDEATFDTEIERACKFGLRMAEQYFPDFSSINSAHSQTATTASEECLETSVHTQSDRSADEDMTTAGSSQTHHQVYWSTSDKAHFRSLLQELGPDFAIIAQRLGTKVAADARQYHQQLVEAGQVDTNAITSEAELREVKQHISPGSKAEEPASNNMITEAGITSDPPPTTSSASGAPVINLGPVVGLPTPPNSQQSEGRSDVPQHHVPAAKEIVPMKSPTKRRKPPRALCPSCTADFRDEYILQRHQSRIHHPTRNIWICVNASPNKKDFLKNCAPCRKERKYLTQNAAIRHLYQKHFDENTTLETLVAWVAEKEVPNPNYRRPVQNLLPPNDQIIPELSQSTSNHLDSNTVSSWSESYTNLPSIETLLASNEVKMEEASYDNDEWTENLDDDQLLPVNNGELLNAYDNEETAYLPEVPL